MNHPFQVGKTYRNRTGEYEVQSIEGDEMIIRYVNGTTLKTRPSVQARIWENIQFEDQMVRDEQRLKLAKEARQAARKRSARARKAASKPRFAGFEQSDFEPKKRGLSWSTREDAGKLLAYEMSRRLSADFGHWIVPRQSEVHIAYREHYDRDARSRLATFFVAASEKGVSYGLRVGNPGGKQKSRGHTPAFLVALAEDKAPRRALRTAMTEHDLTMDVYAMDVSYGQVGQILMQERGLLWQHETADEEMSRKMGWPDLVEYLENVAPNQQSDVLVRTQITAEEAIEAGPSVSTQISAVFESLMPVYDACVSE